jgi:GAF domain-containing protein
MQADPPGDDSDDPGDEEAATRRVATLIAEGALSEQLYAAVTADAGALLGADFADMVRYERDGTVQAIARSEATGDHLAIPERWPVQPGDPLDRVAKLLAPVTVQDWNAESGPISELCRKRGARSSVGVPIVVDGRIWGWLAIHSRRARLARDSDARLSTFGRLLAAAMSNALAHAEVQRLADEQAALPRVATRVAEECPPSAVFSKVAQELATLLGIERTLMLRYEADATATVAAHWTTLPIRVVPPGTRLPLEGESLAARVFRTGRPARMDDYESAVGPIAELAREQRAMGGVGCPITVNGHSGARSSRSRTRRSRCHRRPRRAWASSPSSSPPRSATRRPAPKPGG